MSTATIDNLGAVGVVRDVPPWQLPPNAWSSGQNVRCDNGQIGTFSGHSEFTTPTVTPYYLLTVESDTTYFWIYPGLAKVYAYDGSTHTNITRQSASVDVDYTGSSSDRWNGGVLNSLPVLNNGVDDPQYWASLDTGTDLAILPGWNTAWKAKVVRPYKYHLIALNVTKSSVHYPQLVKTSSAADPGAIPSSWDETDPSIDAGEFPLSDAKGHIVDGLQLGDEFIVYTERGAHGMQWIGGSDVYRFRKLGVPGMLAQGCAVEFKRQHFVVGDGEVYITDGQSYQSIIDQRNRDYLFSQIDTDAYATTFVTHYKALSEIWICYPSSGASAPDSALVWNYSENTWYSRDLPADTRFIANGVITSSALTWDTVPYATWEDWPGSWGSRTYSPVSDSLVAASDTLYKLNDGNQANGSSMECYCERTDLDVGGSDDIHTVTRLYPRMTGGIAEIYVGSQMFPGDAVLWEGPFTFDPSSDHKVDCRVTGRRHAFRVRSNSDVQWTISSLDFDYVFAGRS